MAKFNWLFIITYGRSGSTLLQGILNSINGYDIRGENNFILLLLFRSAMLLKSAQKKIGRQEKSSKDPWYGIENVNVNGFSEEIVSAFIKNTLKPTRHTRVAGFKEIRYQLLQEHEIEDFISFMVTYFDNPCFIFNERNIEDTSISSFWNTVDNPKKIINKALENMKQMYSLLQDRSYWVNYDEYTKNPAQLEGLFAFLDEPFDLDQIQKIMNIKHSY